MHQFDLIYDMIYPSNPIKVNGVTSEAPERNALLLYGSVSKSLCSVSRGVLIAVLE